MKNLSKWMFCLIAVFGIAMLFSACSKDDDNDGPASSEELVGIWKVTKYSYEEKKNGKVTDPEEYGEERNETIVINKDGVIIVAGDYYDKWEYKGGKLKLFYSEEDDKDYDEYSVIKLDKENLILEMQANWKEGKDTYEVYEKYVCKRLSSDDEDEEESGTDNSKLIGIWTHTENDDTYSLTWSITFNANGTFTEKIYEVDNGESSTNTDSGTYSYDEKNKKLVRTYKDSYEETYNVQFSGKDLILTNSTESLTFKR